ncbi:MAG: hypothetical protein EU530_07010 [Promethearchaeota archaeon]|nr:MAG: hypothetical protein EU530_07010 [Candidatus Lokiarchaeota archaeon]
MAKQKVLLIGVDQSIPYLLNKFVEEGVLPNIKNLIDTGTYAEGLSCAPCDTPTNWTTIATGATTAVHGATSFYPHVLGEELDFGAKTRSRSQLSEFTTAEYVWETADRQKVPSFVLNYPAGWPAKLTYGIMSTFTWPIPHTLPIILRPRKNIVYSEKTEKKTLKIQDGSFTLKLSANDIITFKIIDNEKLEYYHKNQLHSLEHGQWGNWLEYNQPYRGNEIGVLRKIRLNQISEDGSSVDIDISPIFNTEGWATSKDFSRNVLKSIVFPEDDPISHGVGYTFEGEMKQVIEFARIETKAITDTIFYAKKHLKWDLCYFHIHHLDTINHNSLGRLHPEFPDYDEKIAETTLSHVRSAYSIMDTMVGDLMERVVDDHTTVVYLSDHGAIPCWRVFNIVKPLVDAGLMVYKKEGNRYKIDWSKTQVFPYMEPTYIWINLKGRDPQGIVDTKDYGSVRDHVIDVLSKLKDPENNKPIMDLVMRKEDHPELHQNGDRIGDIVYFLNSPYNIFDGNLGDMNAAETTLLDRPICYESKEIFGAHAYYLPKKRFGPYSNTVPIIINDLKGNNKKTLKGFTELIDIAPTISEILKIPAPAQSQGKPLKWR